MPAADQSSPRARLSSHVELAAVGGLILGLVVLMAPTLNHRLLEKHDFRQTQTAYTARIFHENGIDLLHPQVPVLGEPFEIPFEFPLYQAAASLLMDVGMPEDTAMRVTTLIFFVTTALLLYGLVRYVAGSVAAIGALAAFVLTPFAVIWSRASMMEYMAAAGAVGFTWAFIAWRDKRRPAIGVLCMLAGLVGMLVKPTTAIFWLLPALAYLPAGSRRVPLRRDIAAATFVVVPVAVATAWTLHADAIKKASATTAWLTSDALRSWNFGTLDQRLDPAVWQQIGEWYVLLLIGPVGILLLLAAGVALRRVEHRRFWIGMTCAAIFPPLVFTNLYRVHDYYVTAVAPAVAALIGLGTAYAVDWLHRPRTRAAAVIAAALLLAAWFAAGYRYWDATFEGQKEQEATTLRLAGELERVTESSDLVAAYGLDWNPAVFYYARRWGHMVVAANEPFAFDLIHAGDYRHFVVKEPHETDLTVFERWSWIGALTEHVYAIADEPSELASARFVTTNERDERHSRGRALAEAPVRIRCDGPVRLPAGTPGTWIELDAPPARVRIAVPGLAPLPARRLVFVSSEAAGGRWLTLTCSGADEIAIVAIREGGPPA